jgi:phosphoribosylformylglycinamidine synthase subunit PurL
MTEVTLDMALAHGLTEDEYERALERVGRPLSYTELGVVSVMWSEHCSYKSSRAHLSKLPTTGPRVVQGPGENAGAIDIGDGWAAVFKMESHNHPSYIEPYQGAATGVGGILRDVFTMGARPIASLNALRFGSPTHERTPYLVSGVVHGIAGYGNCIGVATVGGDVMFDAAFDHNILVNVFNLGVCRHDEIFRAAARGAGNAVLYVGARTGRDGIHGATMASAEFDEATEAKRPTVQVGDPFSEKLLLEACQELLITGPLKARGIGIQDMGAAGLTSSSVEMAGRGGSGIAIDIDRVPRREPGMNAYECLLSESQERMLVVVEPGAEAEVAALFAKWDLECAVIGEVTDTGRLVVTEGGAVVCDLPVDLLTEEAPRYERPTRRPQYLETLNPVDPATLPVTDLGEELMALLGSPNLCSRRAIYEQYDHQVGLGTLMKPGADAAVLRVPGTDRALALTVDCNPRYCYLDPRAGAELAAAESARNLSCVGAEPAGVTDCLNFGNPENPGIMWQLVEAIEGLADACRRLGTPVVSGNVSLYNDTGGKSIYPTPMVGMVGVYEQQPAVEDLVGTGFRRAGDRLVLLGVTEADVDGSEWARRFGLLGKTPPRLHWDRELPVQALVRRLVRDRLVRSAHDLSEGGLGVAVAESALRSVPALGARLEATPGLPDAVWLFSESPSRILLSVAEGALSDVLRVARDAGVPATEIGRVEGDRLVWEGRFDLALEDLRHVWEKGLDAFL